MHYQIFYFFLVIGDYLTSNSSPLSLLPHTSDLCSYQFHDVCLCCYQELYQEKYLTGFAVSLMNEISTYPAVVSTED